MPVENRLPVEILEFVQPNRVIDPNNLPATAKIYDFVKDDGTNLGKVVEETVTGNNGILYTIRNFITTTGAAAGTYLTSGLLAMPIELSVASALGMAGLAIGGGALLNMWFPDVFQKWSDWLFGDTVDGLPVLYWDRYGRLMLDESTLNKTKDFLIQNDAYVDGIVWHDLNLERQTAFNNLRQELHPAIMELDPSLELSEEEIIPYILHVFETYVARSTAYIQFEHDMEDPIKRTALQNFINKYNPSIYLYIFYTRGSWTHDWGSWTLTAIPKKLYNLVHDGELIPAYATWTDVNDVIHENIEKVIHLGISSFYDYLYQSYSGKGVLSNYNELSNRSMYMGLHPINREEFPDVKYIDDSDSRYYREEFNIVKHIETSISTSTGTITRIENTALDTELVSWSFSSNPSSIYVVEDYDTETVDAGNIPSVDREFTVPTGSTERRYSVRPVNPYYNFFPDWGAKGSYDPSDQYFTPYGRFLIDKYIDNRWVTPGATIPLENEDVTVTYPEWPKTVVEGIGNLLHVTPQDLNPTADQSVAQSDGLDIPAIDWMEYFRKLLSQVSPNPEPAPDPQPVPQPTPQPDPDPGLDPGIPPAPNPSNPNTPIEPDPGIIPDPTLVSIGSSRLFTVYNPTEAQLDDFGAWLWSPNPLEDLIKIWQDPMNAIISLHKIYCNPLSSSIHNIMVGYLNTGVSAKVVDSQYVTQSCGTIHVNEVMHNATDYSPYSQAMIYLPFIGIQEIDIDEIMGRDLQVRYTFDVYTGICIAELIVTGTDLTPGRMLYCFNGNAAQQIPLTGVTSQGFFNSLIALCGSGLAVGSGGAVGAIAGIIGAGHSVTHELTHVARSGNLSANAGIMGNRYPQLILCNRNRYDANSYNLVYGYPANKTVLLGNCRGFTKVKSVNVQTFATQPEKDEIETLLKQGVIF